MARRKEYTLINKKDVWYYENSLKVLKMFEPKINEIIVSNKLSGLSRFDLFLKYYTLDFQNMIQVNDKTKFQRPVEVKEAVPDSFKWCKFIFLRD